MNIIQPTSMFDLFQDIKEGFLDWYLSTTYASNGLEIGCLLFEPTSNFPSKDCKIRIYNAFIL